MITGSLVAITTPMFDDGSLDFDSYRKLIDWHIEKGTNGIVAVGTIPLVPFSICQSISLR
jgi:4-hydroxy-tetrahydrodipicolinate synthase